MRGERHKGKRARDRFARCWRCGKVWAPTKEEARRLRALIVADSGDASNPIRYYECAGGWHWTSKKARA